MPLCGEEHTYERPLPFGVYKWPSQRIAGCEKWVALPPAERARTLESYNGCPLCSAYTHTAEECYQKEKRKNIILCKEKVDGKNCGGKHHKLLHGSKSTYCRTAAVRATAATNHGDVVLHGPKLLEMVKCPARGEGGREATALVFTDGGSTLSLIRTDFANHLGLEGTYLEFYIRVVGHEYVRKESKMYTFNLVDRQGHEHPIQAVGISSISETGPVPDMTPIQALFPGFPAVTFQRPQGEVDILLGMNNRRLHPNGVKDVEDLRVMESRLGPPYLVTGSHPALTHTGSEVLPEARELSAAVLILPAHSGLKGRDNIAPAQDQADENLGGTQARVEAPQAKQTNEQTSKKNLANRVRNKRTSVTHKAPAARNKRTPPGAGQAPCRREVQTRGPGPPKEGR